MVQLDQGAPGAAKDFPLGDWWSADPSPSAHQGAATPRHVILPAAKTFAVPDSGSGGNAAAGRTLRWIAWAKLSCRKGELCNNPVSSGSREHHEDGWVSACSSAGLQQGAVLISRMLLWGGMLLLRGVLTARADALTAPADGDHISSSRSSSRSNGAEDAASLLAETPPYVVPADALPIRFLHTQPPVGVCASRSHPFSLQQW